MASANRLGDEPADVFAINEKYQTKEFGEFVRQTIGGQTENSAPFPHLQLKDFLVDGGGELAGGLRAELKAAKWSKNENDLNAIWQTRDIGAFDVEKFPQLRAFREFLRTKGREFLQKITGFKLNDQLALTGSRYDQTDYLSPHDDSLDGRKIAFVLYLTLDWKPEYGGELALYSADGETNRPTEIAKKLQPTAGSLVIFPVQTNTWHSVLEVTSPDHSRLSLNGWFHADDAKSAAPPKPEPPIQRIRPALNITLNDVEEWINGTYLIPHEQKQIKRQFAAKSELFLESFLNADRYQQALAELKAARFEQVGPPDRRHFFKLDESSLKADSPLSTLLKFFRSDALTLLLTQWTGIKLFDLNAASSSPPTKRAKVDEGGDQQAGPSTSAQKSSKNREIELVSFVHRYEHGCYTMADEQMAADGQTNGYCLDVLLFFGDFDEWPEEAGGFVSFIAIDDPNEIMRVPPRTNCLAIVFREPEILNFIKYLNCKAAGRSYYLIGCSFFGASNEESDEEEDSLDDDSNVSTNDDESEEAADEFEEEDEEEVHEEETDE
ncbi:hypothetical protein M3Y99_01315500 [Aphelenchoides fujianensis]|nr:hypothetical protein M3Y99_01315500 [Aphelenchoides fujianensis]